MGVGVIEQIANAVKPVKKRLFTKGVEGEVCELVFVQSATRFSIQACGLPMDGKTKVVLEGNIDGLVKEGAGQWHDLCEITQDGVFNVAMLVIDQNMPQAIELLHGHDLILYAIRARIAGKCNNIQCWIIGK